MPPRVSRSASIIDNDPVAFRLECEREARKGTPDGLFSLGIIHEYGIGGARKPAKALQLYTQAAELGLVEAQAHLGEMYSLGLNIPQDTERAVFWLTRASEAGDTEGTYGLAALLEVTARTPEQINRVSAMFQRCADEGHAESLLHLAYIKLGDLDRQSDLPGAQILFQKALDQGIEEAREPLVELLLESGDQASFRKARLLLQESPVRSPHALYTLANLLNNADGGPANKSVAAKLFRKAANRGDRHAAFARAQMLEFGDGVPADWGKAWQMYTHLAGTDEDKIGTIAEIKLSSMMERALSANVPDFVEILEPANDIAAIAPRPSPPQKPRPV